MSLLAIFGITNDGLNLAANLLLLFLVVFWIALIYWTYADARRRIADPMLVGCATAASLFPYVGTVVYLIVRPPEYLEDVRERELEIAAAEARLAGSDSLACPHCSYEVEKAFLRCPGCLRRLKEPCATCGKPLDPRWSICPYCEAEVGQGQPAPRQRPRRRERPPAAAAAAPPQRSAPPAQRPASAPAQRSQEPRPARSAPQRSQEPQPAPQRSQEPRPPRPAPQRSQEPRPPRPAPQRSQEPPRPAPQRSAPPPRSPAAQRTGKPSDERTEESRAARPVAQRPARSAEGGARPPAPAEGDAGERPATRPVRP